MPRRKSTPTKKKAKTPKVFRFEAPLERHRGFFRVTFPDSVEEVFGTKSSVRVNAIVNGIPIDRALIPAGDGTHHLLLPIELRRKAKLRLGDIVNVEFTQNMQPDQIIIPEELQAALDLEPNGMELFNSLNMSMRRNVVYWVNSAKRTETRVERSIVMLKRILSGVWHNKKRSETTFLEQE